MPPTRFTIAEADRLVPDLQPLMRRLVEQRQALRAHERAIEEFRDGASKSGGGIPGERFGQARAEAERLGAEIAAGIRHWHGLREGFAGRKPVEPSGSR